ncbi:MAG: hypothetical protein Q8754_02830, partial [Sweet potato little leaf phytoplasma]|nr:hypothetical protein [Sweet potato little leaf phytoplasma]
CVYCGENHNYEFCPSNPASVFFVGNQRNNPYSNFYNPGWCNHPNFSWGGQGSNVQAQKKVNQSGFAKAQVLPQQNKQALPQQNSGSSLEAMMKEFMARIDAAIQSNQASMRALELQVSQLANELKARPQGKLSSDTEHPRREGKEQVKAVTLRNGKPLEEKMSLVRPRI